MEITKVIIQKIVRDKDDLRAMLSINFDDAFTVHDIKIIEANGRLFVAMPSRRTGSGYADVAHPINQQMRHELEARVIAAYNECIMRGRDGYPIPWMNPAEDDADEERFIPPTNEQEALMRAALSSAIESGRLQCDFPGPPFNIAEAFQLKTFQALDEIRAILDDDSLDDFMCVEKIVGVFEALGSDGGSRHDFG